MADKVIAEFAAERGLMVQRDAAFYSADGYMFSVALYPALQRWGVSVPIQEDGWNKDIQKELNRALKEQKAGTMVYVKGCVQLAPKGNSKKTRFAGLDKSITILLQELPRLRLRPRTVCPVCGAERCNDYVVEDKIFYPIHTGCKEQKAARILAEVQENRQSGSMLLGLVGAVIGGIVGSLPALLVAMLANIISAYLFLLIPMASYWGYKKAKGVMNSIVPFLNSIIALLCTVAVMVICYLKEGFEVWPGRQVIVIWSQIMRYARKEFLLDLGKAMVFCLIGIAISWSYISKSNKHKIKEAEEILQSNSPMGR